MSLDKQTVQHIARLAKLEISEEQVSSVAAELDNIIDLVEQMSAVATDGIEAMTHPFDASLRLREDEVTAGDQREKLLALSKDSEQGLFTVPKVIE